MAARSTSARPDDVLARSSAALERAGVWLPEGAGQAPLKTPRASGASRPQARRASAADGATLPILELEEVRFSFERDLPVLRAVDLTVMQGARIALVGANGSGKTTLLRLALGLLRPIAGSVRLGGRDPRRMPPIQVARLAGYVVQDPELGFLADSVQEEVELGLERSRSPTRASCASDSGCRWRPSGIGARTGSPAANSAGSRS